jgi:cytochrome c
MSARNPALRSLVILAVLAGSAACNDAETRRVEAITRGRVKEGREAIRRFGCGACHVIPGIAGADALVGPSLERIASRMYIAGHLVNEPRSMIEWIRDPRHHRNPTAMPNLGVSDQDARDIAAYLYTLK